MKNVRLKVLLASCLAVLGCTEQNGNGIQLASCGDGVSCPNGLDCVEGLCKRPVEAGGSCASSDAYCVSGTCNSNFVCSSDGSSEVTCDNQNNPCPNNMVCVANQCVKPAAVGNTCKYDEGCSQGKCVDGKCRITMLPGQTCDDAHICGEGYQCHDDVCLKPVQLNDDCRSSLVYCEDGACAYGICVAGSGTANCLDTDGDTISDEYDNCTDDTDGDTLVNCQDLDSDGDTLPDAIEAGSDPCRPPMNSDNYSNQRNDIPDFLELDSDKNGIPDSEEGVRYVLKTPEPTEDNPTPSPILVQEYVDTDGDTILDSSDEDNDGDGVWDILEIPGLPHKDYTHLGSQSPRAADCNGDTLPDEIGSVENPFDCDSDTIPDYNDADGDNDDLLDLYEGQEDSDYDGYFDRYEQDSDNDGLTDTQELNPDGTPRVSIPGGQPDFRIPDLDDDGLLDGLEPVCTITLKCGATEAACSQKCVDIMSDVNNCGGCGIQCLATSSCVDGACVANCAETEIACGESCIHPTADAQNCGSCGNVCGTGQICSTEGCVDVTDLTCEDGKTGCWGECKDLQNDAQNCGACGNACDSGLSCVEGACVLICADTALTACANTACVDITKDVNNCGSCGNACDTNQTCSAEGCVYVTDLTCEDGKTGCWGTCEDLQNDAQNCGACGNVCPTNYACEAGTCKSTKQPDNIVIVDARLVGDADDDGFGDNSEYIAATSKGASPETYICDAAYGVVGNPEAGIEGAFEFYFELPYEGDEKRDTLNFKPSVSKLDVIFNVDTTNSMGVEVANLKEKISDTIIPGIRQRVTDSAIGVSRFDDFPTRSTKDSKYDYLVGNSIEDGYGKTTGNDVPFQLLGRPETNNTTIQTNVNKLGLHHGGDFPESGYEALWQLVMGDDKTYAQTYWKQYASYSVFSSGNIAYTPSVTGRWGGGQFRDASLPVVVHITDTTSHDDACNCPEDSTLSTTTISAFCSGNGKTTCKPYDPIYVQNAHYSKDVHKAYQDKGARIISVYRQDGTQLEQLVDTSNATQAVVPVCAFQTETGWKCGENKCCTRSNASGSAIGVDHDGGKCVLSYGIASGNHLSTTLVDGVDALVKYATSEVAAVVRGESMPGYDHDTSCFIKGVVAFNDVDEAGNAVTDKNGKAITGYVAPPQEPEASCNPIAQPMAFDGAAYNNGYSNFAIGTSSSAKAGAQLNFIVKAQNDICAKPTEQAQVFQAHIDVIDPKTGMIFGTQRVSIVVPGVKAGQIN
jgi:hypothetical protein